MSINRKRNLKKLARNIITGSALALGGLPADVSQATENPAMAQNQQSTSVLPTVATAACIMGGLGGLGLGIANYMETKDKNKSDLEYQRQQSEEMRRKREEAEFEKREENKPETRNKAHTLARRVLEHSGAMKQRPNYKEEINQDLATNPDTFDSLNEVLGVAQNVGVQEAQNAVGMLMRNMSDFLNKDANKEKRESTIASVVDRLTGIKDAAKFKGTLQKLCLCGNDGNNNGPALIDQGLSVEIKRVLGNADFTVGDQNANTARIAGLPRGAVNVGGVLDTKYTTKWIAESAEAANVILPRGFKTMLNNSLKSWIVLASPSATAGQYCGTTTLNAGANGANPVGDYERRLQVVATRDNLREGKIMAWVAIGTMKDENNNNIGANTWNRVIYLPLQNDDGSTISARLDSCRKKVGKWVLDNTGIVELEEDGNNNLFNI